MDRRATGERAQPKHHLKVRGNFHRKSCHLGRLGPCRCPCAGVSTVYRRTPATTRWRKGRLTMFDLGFSGEEMARLVSGVHADQLDDPTPCAEWTVADLLAHIHQLAAVFTSNARKEPPRPPDALVDGWPEAIPAQLRDLVGAWRMDAAWEGRASAGGVDMAAADNAVVAIEELTVHGWDLAQATGQEIVVNDASLNRVEEFFVLFGDNPFGSAASAPLAETRFQRVLVRTGRDPSWRAGG
jgi:uncharacterized protein (TIGR03086 family)